MSILVLLTISILLYVTNIASSFIVPNKAAVSTSFSSSNINLNKQLSRLSSSASAAASTNNQDDKILKLKEEDEDEKKEAVRKLLNECKMLYLSTVDLEESSSHLSLMRFTYLYDEEDGEVVVMSTNRKTKKFAMLQKQKGVALLVHDFEQKGGGEVTSGGFSITLKGQCRIVTDVEKAEKYRLAHLERNPEFPQFIVGDDIAILCVDVKSTRVFYYP